MNTRRPTLPGGYWWSDAKDRSVLYLCYGWAATVTPTATEVRTRRGSPLKGRCGSIAQGKRFVERWVIGQTYGTYRQERARRAPPKPYMPAPADRAMAELRRLPPPAPVARIAQAGQDDAEMAAWAWRTDVPFEDLVKAARRL